MILIDLCKNVSALKLTIAQLLSKEIFDFILKIACINTRQVFQKSNLATRPL